MQLRNSDYKYPKMNLSKKFFKYSYFIIVIAFFWLSCKKDSNFFDTTSKLTFSADTVLFDTVFTTVGSITQNVKIYNTSSKKILVSSIRLGGGNSSNFTLNIDGSPVNTATDIELEPNDSMYIFVKVTVDPTNQHNPFIFSDSVMFETNGNIQQIKLVAWGQNAHFITADHFYQGLPPFKIVAAEGHTVTWDSILPYVIYGYAVVDSAAILNIKEGTKIYFHANSGLWVYRYGSLNVNGTKDHKVIFQSDRLDIAYRNIPGQWDRIWINESPVDSKIEHAVIKNAFIGIQAESWQELSGNRLYINNTIIENITGVGLYAKAYNISGYNDIVANCGQYGVALTYGGDYDFSQCTFSNYWSMSSKARQTPTLILNNYNEIQTFDMKKANFSNCIIYGNIDNEIEIDKKANSVFNCRFDYCLLKFDPTKTTIDASNSEGILQNPDPEFADYSIGNYALKSSSPAIDKGKLSVGQLYPMDLKGNSRIGGLPDIGALEYAP